MAPSSIIPPTPSQEAYAVDEDQGDVFAHDDPFALFDAWLALAVEKEPNDANAMALATVDGAGLPDVRMVLLKDVSKGGLTFYTNRTSAKGGQILASKKAALCFHWKTLRRQVRVRGRAAEVTAQEADAYFATRARGARIGAWASKQSAPLSGPEALRAAVAVEERRFDGVEDVPRPDDWCGFRVVAETIEFWVNRPFRLHERLQFTKVGDGWERRYLNP